MKKQNVLYFTIVSLASPSNGGLVCILNHILRLSQEPQINLFVVIAGAEIERKDAVAQLNKLKVKHYFIALREESWRYWPRIKKILNFGWRIVYPYPWELQSFNQEHISQYIKNLCNKLCIKVIVVDYLFSTLFFKDFLNLKQTKVYIALNRETEMYKERLELKNVPEYQHKPIKGFISYLRLQYFERKIHRSIDKLILITEADIPLSFTEKSKSSVIVPYLDPKPIIWNYTGSNQIFFVGSSYHYPNYLAIQWLMCELAPKLLKLNSSIKILIAGTAPNQIPTSWQIENTKLLGFVTQEELDCLFRKSDIFICPIKNDHGVKMKSLECLSYGIPLLATSGTLKGLPYLYNMPVLELDKPDKAAHYIGEILSDRNALEELSQKIINSLSDFALSQKNRWTETILD